MAKQIKKPVCLPPDIAQLTIDNLYQLIETTADNDSKVLVNAINANFRF